MINLPRSANRIWSTGLDSDLYGDVTSARNINLDREGYLSLARRGGVIFSEDDDDDYGILQGIVADEDNLYAVTEDGAFISSLNVFDDLTFAQIESLAGLSVNTDVTMYAGIMHASTTTAVESFSGGVSGTWISRITGLSASYPHPLCVSEHQNSLAVGDGRNVKLYNSSYSLSTTMVLPSEYVVTWIRWRQSTLYIGTRNISGGEAKMFTWNGSGTAANSGYGAQCSWIYSGCEYDSSIAIVTSAGQVKRFNGGGFSEIANLPIYSTPFSWESSASITNINGKVASRGMQAHGELLYINIDGSADITAGQELPGPYLPQQPSGLWVYDPVSGLYPKAGYNLYTYTDLALSALASDTFTVPAGHMAETCDPIYCGAVGSVTGLTAGKTYFAIKVSETTFKLALSCADADNGRAITLGGAVTSAVLSIDNKKTVGGTYTSNAGAVHVIGRVRPNLFFGSEVIFGGSAYDESLSTKNVLMSLGMGYSVGRIVSPKLLSDKVMDFYNRLIQKITPLRTDRDEIVVKYRIRERFGLPTPYAQLVWTSPNSFTVDTSTYDFKSVEVGDEIEFTAGAAAGYTAHITSINTDSSLYGVEVDESFTVTVGNTSAFIVDNWIKATVFNKDSQDNEIGMTRAILGEEVKGTWGQIKIEMRGYNVTLEGQKVINSTAENDG